MDHCQTVVFLCLNPAELVCVVHDIYISSWWEIKIVGVTAGDSKHVDM